MLSKNQVDEIVFSIMNGDSEQMFNDWGYLAQCEPHVVGCLDRLTKIQIYDGLTSEETFAIISQIMLGLMAKMREEQAEVNTSIN